MAQQVAAQHSAPATAGRVAVVIITRDRARDLMRTLARLHELVDGAEIVVVDHASKDGTAQLVQERFPAVRVLQLDQDRGASGRNAGVELVDCPYIAFCDDDSWWAAGALARGALVLDAHPTVALVAGRVLLGPELRLDPACEAMRHSPLGRHAALPGPRVLGFVACGAIVRRSAFLAVGGFARRLAIGAEEQLLATDLATAGWDLIYRDVLVAHHHPSPARDRSERRTLQARNELWFAWLRRRFPSALRLTLRAAGRALTEPAARAGIIRALRGAAWAASARRPVSRRLEAELRQLEGPTRSEP